MRKGLWRLAVLIAVIMSATAPMTATAQSGADLAGIGALAGVFRAETSAAEDTAGRRGLVLISTETAPGSDDLDTFAAFVLQSAGQRMSDVAPLAAPAVGDDALAFGAEVAADLANPGGVVTLLIFAHRDMLAGLIAIDPPGADSAAVLADLVATANALTAVYDDAPVMPVTTDELAALLPPAPDGFTVQDQAFRNDEPAAVVAMARKLASRGTPVASPIATPAA